SVAIASFVAHVEVTQVFANPHRDTIDADYLFPLPAGATVDDIVLEVGGRRIQDGALVIAQARKGTSVFTRRTAGLEPGAAIRVRIRYVEPLLSENGVHLLSFPMVAG